MVGAMISAAIGLWVVGCILVLSLCRAAKVGDRTMQIAYARQRSRDHRAIRRA